MIIRNNREVKHIYHDGKLVKERYRNGKLVHKEEQGGEDNYTLRFHGNGTLTMQGWVSTMNGEYSKDNTPWTAITASTTSVSLGQGETLYLRGDNPDGLNSSSSHLKLRASMGNFTLSGDIMSLIYPLERLNTKVIPCDYCFNGLFESNRALYELDENFKMSAEVLKPYCYYNIFYSCSKLRNAPQLPATTLAEGSYSYMFNGCSSLTTAPQLPATSLASKCYANIFLGCTSLTTAPSILPATTLVEGCYSGLFSGCSNLVTPPVLPQLQRIELDCCTGMFRNCVNLNETIELKVMGTQRAQRCFKNMYYGCTSLIEAKPIHFEYGIWTSVCESMFENCTSLTKVNLIKVDEKNDYDYFDTYSLSNMFKGCTNLNYIKVDAKRWNNSASINWLDGVSPTGTFVKPSGVTLPTGTNGIPEGWTVEEY